MSSKGYSIVEDHVVNTTKKILYAEYSTRGRLTSKTVEIDLCSIPAKYGLDQESFLLSLVLLESSNIISLDSIKEPSLECLKIIGRTIGKLDLLHLEGKLSKSTYVSMVRSLYYIAGMQVNRVSFPSVPRSPVDEERMLTVLSQLVAEPCRKIKVAMSILETVGVPGKTLMAALAEELGRYVATAKKLWGERLPGKTEGKLATAISLIQTIDDALKGDLAGKLGDLANMCDKLGVVE